jgi:hypothetical protein
MAGALWMELYSRLNWGTFIGTHPLDWGDSTARRQLLQCTGFLYYAHSSHVSVDEINSEGVIDVNKIKNEPGLRSIE